MVRDIASQMGIERSAVRSLLETAGQRVAGTLSFKHSPLQLKGDDVEAIDFAGMIALGPRMEIEIAPKFIGDADGWQDDFFLIALLAQHGHILEEGLAASASTKTDLPTLLARALVALYWKHRRRPIRTYRRTTMQAFEIEGDFDPVDLNFPDEEGFPQDVTVLTRSNEFNGVLRRAASTLALSVQDAETRLRLERVVHDLPPAAAPIRLTERRLPSRSGAWKPTYQLGLEVLRGLSGSLTPGGSEAPGFVVDTWRAWEALLSLAVRSHFGGRVTRAQRPATLGVRRKPSGAQRALTVTPDLVVDVKGAHGAAILVDAKYKGNQQKGRLAVQPADVYESLAFARATGLEVVCLVYPRIPDTAGVAPVGTVRLFEAIEVGSVRILAMDVSVPGLSERGGLRTFSENLGLGMMSIVENGNLAYP